MKRLISIVSTLVFLAAAVAGAAGTQTAPAPKAVDITGQWTATFDSQVGAQTYTYDFVAKDGKLTGKMKGSLSEAPSEVVDGKVVGDAVTFVENLSFQGMALKVSYTGKIASVDEIKFTRNVADLATEEIVAKRVKK